MAFVWVENHALFWAGVWHGACVSGKPSARLGRGMAWRLLGWKTRRSFGQGHGMALVWVENQALVWAGIWHIACVGGKSGARSGRGGTALVKVYLPSLLRGCALDARAAKESTTWFSS